jgi:hypothetical protein
MKINAHIWLYLSHFVWEWEIFQTKSCRVNQIARFTFSNFFSESRSLYETVLNNIVESDRPQTIIRRMRIAYLINEAGGTHSEDVILQNWLHETPYITYNSLYYVIHTLPVLFFYTVGYRSLIYICSTLRCSTVRCLLRGKKNVQIFWILSRKIFLCPLRVLHYYWNQPSLRQ